MSRIDVIQFQIDVMVHKHYYAKEIRQYISDRWNDQDKKYANQYIDELIEKGVL